MVIKNITLRSIADLNIDKVCLKKNAITMKEIYKSKML